MDYSLPFLGKNVYVKIDRPLGSKHPKHGYNYPINYGYIPDTIAPDGSGIDVYILGEDKPLKTFHGQCIAIIHRLDDDDDKLVVCDPNKKFTDDQIKKHTHFQEQWFNSEIIRR